MNSKKTRKTETTLDLAPGFTVSVRTMPGSHSVRLNNVGLIIGASFRRAPQNLLNDCIIRAPVIIVAPDRLGSTKMADLLLSDIDPGFHEDCNTEHTNIISDGYPFCHKNGRRYHSIDGCLYPLPNDGEEMRRLNRFHAVYYQIFGKRNILVPLQYPKLILDMGCGSGSFRWSLNRRGVDGGCFD